MQFMLDHISSVLIAGAVLLLVLNTQFNSQRSAAEQTIAYASKMQTLDMADYMEDEIILIGDGTSNTITELTNNLAGETTTFTFWRDDASGTDMMVSYTLTETDSVEIKNEWVQLYRLDRFENGSAAGGGSSTLEHFRITMLTESGATTTNVASARLVRIIAVNVYPYGNPDDHYLFRNYWGITLRPMNLES